MSPLLDPDFLNDMSPSLLVRRSPSIPRPLLVLSPSSLSHRPQVLESLLSTIPSTQPHDLQMLDRIALNFVQLPQSHYTEAILALPNTEETSGQVDKDYAELKAVFSKILDSMQPGGRVLIGRANEQVTKEAILSGFLVENENQQVPLYSVVLYVNVQTVLVKPASTAAVPLNLKRSRPSSKPKKKLDFLSLDSSDTIDESTLLHPQDFTKPIIQPQECAPAPGKRRKACKNCTCGLKDLEDSENENARKLPVVVLGEDELDFTVQGKSSSCGSCSLGDAFRCSGCIPPTSCCLGGC